ncbi:MAG TPA: hypothetical protein VLK89_00055 [Solirubrobacterales bacterium]|nr:hypothetical protein [Solirubrobacterales bacterium]
MSVTARPNIDESRCSLNSREGLHFVGWATFCLDQHAANHHFCLLQTWSLSNSGELNASEDWSSFLGLSPRTVAELAVVIEEPGDLIDTLTGSAGDANQSPLESIVPGCQGIRGRPERFKPVSEHGSLTTGVGCIGKVFEC